jgi:hypothetical protein
MPLLGGFLLLLLLLAACGRGSYIAAVRVSILNDTRKSVTVQECEDEACTRYRDGTILNPGETTELATDDQGTPNPVQVVLPPRGTVVACLPLVFEDRPEREPVTVRISDAITCREEYG